MNTMRERVNQSTNDAPGFLQKAVHAKAAGILPAPSHALPPIRKEAKVEAAIAVRKKRIRVAQDHVIRTAGKENGNIIIRSRPDDVKNIYEEDVGCEMLVIAYVEHIYAYLHQREKLRLNAAYMDGMSVNARMRAILMDWMVSVAYKFGMCQDTLFLAVDIVDRFLATPDIDVTKDELQMIGVTAMFMAGKFEEVYPPELEEYVYIADNSCTKEQVLDAEIMITCALKFDFTRPSPVHFLRRNCKAAEASTEEYCTAKYIAELSILNIAFVEIVPSMTAAAAMYLTMLMYRAEETTPVWTLDMAYYSGHEETVLLSTAEKLLDLVKGAPKGRHQCIYKKYNNAKLFSVASFATKAAQKVVLSRVQE